MAFWNRTPPEPKNNKVYDDVLAEIKLVHTQIGRIQAQLDALETKQNSLRGLINRKVGFEEKQEETEKNLNKDGFGDVREMRKKQPWDF